MKLTGLAVLLALAAGIPRLQTTDELRLLTALTPETAHELKRMGKHPSDAFGCAVFCG